MERGEAGVHIATLRGENRRITSGETLQKGKRGDHRQEGGVKKPWEASQPNI